MPEPPEQLPLDFGPRSNGEFVPVPLTPVQRESMRRLRAVADDRARRLGMTRRQFLASAVGMTTAMAILNACSREEAATGVAPTPSPPPTPTATPSPTAVPTPTSEPGGSFEVPEEAVEDVEAAEDLLAGDELVFDLQTHFLEYETEPPRQNGIDFWRFFDQPGCTGRECFDLDSYFELVFGRSDTDIAMLSALPILPMGSPLDRALMLEARAVAETVCGPDRLLLHGQALPNVGDLDLALAGMAELAASSPVAAWKCYTHFTPGGAAPWRLDDGDASVPAVGRALIEKAIEVGVPRITVHKGLSSQNPWSSPADLGPAAAAYPDVSFVAYHSGFEVTTTEGPFEDATRDVGVNRLVAGMADAGVGPNENVYAELGSTWWLLRGRPTEAAHVLGKLLLHVGEDNVLWGTDSLWYGSPQDQIESFRVFEIGEELQERFGYPALTPERKRKIFGVNAARLHGLDDPARTSCTFSPEAVAAYRQESALLL